MQEQGCARQAQTKTAPLDRGAVPKGSILPGRVLPPRFNPSQCYQDLVAVRRYSILDGSFAMPTGRAVGTPQGIPVKPLLLHGVAKLAENAVRAARDAAGRMQVTILLEGTHLITRIANSARNPDWVRIRDGLGAELLGVNPNTLAYRMRALGIKRSRVE